MEAASSVCEVSGFQTIGVTEFSDDEPCQSLVVSHSSYAELRAQQPSFFSTPRRVVSHRV